MNFEMPRINPEAAIESELSPEAKKEKIMEGARERRLGLAGRTFDRVAEELHISAPAKRLISWLVNLTPVSMPKMIIEGIKGETVGGEKLTPYDRIMHLTIQAANITAWGLGVWKLSTGDTSYALPAKIYAASWAIWAVYELPKIAKNSKDVISENREKVMKFFDKMSAIINKPVPKGVGEPSPEMIKMLAEAN